MRILLAIALVATVGATDRAVRLPQNPIVTPASSPTIGDNINGPSLIRVPSWVERPLGRYYLYFAHHAGKFIRLAYADQLAGPWTIHEPGTIRLEDAPQCFDHIASPDVHIDETRREILMYFHCPSGPLGRVDSNGRVDISQQPTFLASSRDGLRFTVDRRPLGPAYFRVFRWGEFFYTIVRAGIVLRSRDMRSPFEPGPTLIRADSGELLRHAAVDLRGDVLRIYYSRIGDRPERILLSEVRLTADWSTWRASAPVTVLSPDEGYEGADRPLEVSMPNEAPGRVRQLRDPAIFKEGSRTYLLYSIAGESGIAISELRGEPPPLEPLAFLLGTWEASGGRKPDAFAPYLAWESRKAKAGG
ncbi:MAG: hypothetical protein IMZ67_07585 [Acidobacteria bacterium]|nr:hypothetical protein [Acidobacteriota bacterium]